MTVIYLPYGYAGRVFMMSYDLSCYGRTILILIVYEHGAILTQGECRSWAGVRDEMRDSMGDRVR